MLISRVDSKLSRIAQSFSTAGIKYRPDSEQDILNTASVDDSLDSYGSRTSRTSRTSNEQKTTDEESLSSDDEHSEGDEDMTDDDDEGDSDAESVGSKTHASDATGFQLMGTASAVLVHPGDTFMAISEEISCILGKR